MKTLKSTAAVPAMFAVALVLGLTSPRAEAAAFTGTYSFTGTTGDAASAGPDATSTQVVLGNFTRGSLTAGTNTAADNNKFSSGGFVQNQGTLANAITNGAYVTFSISANPGQKFSLTSLTFKSETAGTRPPDTLSIKYQTNGANSWSTGTTSLGTPNANGTFNTAFNSTALSNLSNITSVVFRIYAYGQPNGSQDGTARVRLDDVNVGGTSTPEPTAAFLAALAAGGLLLRRNRDSGDRVEGQIA